MSEKKEKVSECKINLFDYDHLTEKDEIFEKVLKPEEKNEEKTKYKIELIESKQKESCQVDDIKESFKQTEIEETKKYLKYLYENEILSNLNMVNINSEVSFETEENPNKPKEIKSEENQIELHTNFRYGSIEFWKEKTIKHLNLSEEYFMMFNLSMKDSIIMTKILLLNKFANLDFLEITNTPLLSVEFLSFIDAPNLTEFRLEKNQLNNINTFSKYNFKKLRSISTESNFIFEFEKTSRIRFGNKHRNYWHPEFFNMRTQPQQNFVDFRFMYKLEYGVFDSLDERISYIYWQLQERLFLPPNSEPQNIKGVLYELVKKLVAKFHSRFWDVIKKTEEMEENEE